MRENVARRMLIHASPQLGPLRPIDIYEDSQDEDDDAYQPAGSSAAPTAAPAPAGYLPPLVIGRALDVLNAPGSTRKEFQALFNSRNLGPGDVEELNPQLWEEFAQGTSQVLDRPPGSGPSTARRDTPIAEIPRTSLEGLEGTNPNLHQEFINELRMEESNSERLSESETSWPSEDAPRDDAAPGASSMPRTAQRKRPPPRPPSSSSGSQNVASAGCDVSYQSDLVRVDNLPVLDEGCNSTCHSNARGELAEDRLRQHGLTFPWIDSSAKSFAGLGSSTTTMGKRNPPFCTQVGEASLVGVMESHEVDTEAFNPLLISLFAQAKLGLIKDMSRADATLEI